MTAAQKAGAAAAVGLAVKRGLLSSSDYTKQVNSIRPTVSWKNFEGVDVVIDTSAGDAGAIEPAGLILWWPSATD